MVVTKSILDGLVGGVLPAWTSRRVAAVLGMNQRTVQRLVAEGAVFAPGAEKLAILDEQRAAVAESDLINRLREAIVAANAAGVHPEVVSAWLDDTHRLVTGQPIE